MDGWQDAAWSPGGREGLESFHADLLRFNRSLNLVSRQQGDEAVGWMLRECASFALALPAAAGARVLDIGSGAGLPGFPVAILRPELSVELLERRRSRCDWLRRERAALGLEDLVVHEGDATRLVREAGRAGAYDHVLLKAVAPPGEALGLAAPWLKPGGRAWIFRDVAFDPMGVEAPGYGAPTRIELDAAPGVAPRPAAIGWSRQP